MTKKNNQKCTGLEYDRDLTTIKSKSITCDHCKNWFCMECSNIPKKIFNGIITCNKKEDVSMLIFICERCKANNTDLKDRKRDIFDIRKELSKMCNDIEESSTDIKTHIEKKKVPRNFNPNVVDKRIFFANIVKKCKMPNLDSINEHVKNVR